MTATDGVAASRTRRAVRSCRFVAGQTGALLAQVPWRQKMARGTVGGIRRSAPRLREETGRIEYCRLKSLSCSGPAAAVLASRRKQHRPRPVETARSGIVSHSSRRRAGPTVQSVLCAQVGRDFDATTVGRDHRLAGRTGRMEPAIDGNPRFLTLLAPAHGPSPARPRRRRRRGSLRGLDRRVKPVETGDTMSCDSKRPGTALAIKLLITELS